MSTNKTPNCRLHSWEGSDSFLLSEINQNFTAIDAALAAVRSDAGTLAAEAEAAAKAASRPAGWTPTAAEVGAVPSQAAELPAGADLNECRRIGYYYCGLTATCNTLVNKPPISGAFSMQVVPYAGPNSAVGQIVRFFSNSRTFIRTYSAGANGWGDWHEYYSDSHKPTAEEVGAAPAVHTHTPDEIGAAPAAHSHTAADLSGVVAQEPTVLIENQDLDNCRTVGYYICTTSAVSSTLVNRPPANGAFSMVVEPMAALKFVNRKQTVTFLVSGRVFYRTRTSNGWTDWNEVVTKQSSLSMVVGTYTGTGSQEVQTIELGIAPKLVLVGRTDAVGTNTDSGGTGRQGYFGLAAPGIPCGGGAGNGLELTASGFIAGTARAGTPDSYYTTGYFNDSGVAYTYAALY